MKVLSVVLVVLIGAACGKSGSSSNATSESESEAPAAKAKPGSAARSAWWPSDAAAWASIKGECTGEPADQSWCAMPAHTDVARLGAFIEGRPSLVLALASDPAHRERLDQLFAYLLEGDPERGVGRVAGIAAGATGVVTVAALEGWKRPDMDQLAVILRAVLAGAALANVDTDAIAYAVARRAEASESDVAGATPAARFVDAVRHAWGDVRDRETERLHVDFSSQECDRAIEGAEDTLACRYEVMSARLMKMLGELASSAR